MRKLFAVNTPPSGYDHDEPAWIAARRRLALYLAALELPQGEAQRLLETAVAQAKASHPVMPLPAAMAALQGLLSARDAAQPPVPLSMPKIHREVMLPEKIERSPLRFLVSEFLRPALLGTARQGHRHRLLLICTTVAAGLLLGRHLG